MRISMQTVRTLIFFVVASAIIIPAPIFLLTWMDGRSFDDAIHTCHC